jgi:hypothetical protein
MLVEYITPFMKRLVLSLASVLVALFAAFGWVLAGQDVAASPAAPPAVVRVPVQSTGPNVVQVGIYVLNIGKLDTATGAFTVDFYMSFTCDNNTTPGGFEFANGRATSVEKSVDEPTLKFYRVQASLVDNLDLSRYPFDRHSLTIEIEDKDQTSSTQVYEVSQADCGLDPAVNIAGWSIDGWRAGVADHYYAPYDTTFSKFVFSVDIRRPVTAAIFKTFLPALIIVLMGLLSLVLTPDKIIPRLTLTAGALTGAVLFHLNMTSSLPPLGYITFGDRFMLINYVGLAMALVSTLGALAYVDRKQNDKANRIHRLALIIVPSVWVGAQLLNFLLR